MAYSDDNGGFAIYSRDDNTAPPSLRNLMSLRGAAKELSAIVFTEPADDDMERAEQIIDRSFLLADIVRAQYPTLLLARVAVERYEMAVNQYYNHRKDVA